MNIPYSIEPRPSTGLTNAMLGMLLFLASEVMLFGALVTSYVFLRESYSGWTGDDGLPGTGLALFNTLAMAGSSATMAMAGAAHRRGRPGACRLMLAAAALLGALFILVTGNTWQGAFAAGIYPSTNTFAAISFVLTGLHALHVAGGVVANGFLIILRRSTSPPGTAQPVNRLGNRLGNRLAVTGIYWHFLTAVWLVTILILRYA